MNDALGNYVVALPVVDGLSRIHPDAEISFFGGLQTKEFWEREPRFARTQLIPRHRPLLFRGEPFDLVVNLERADWAADLAGSLASPATVVIGPARFNGVEIPFESNWRGNIWRDCDWTSPDLLARHPRLISPYISDIFLALVGGAGAAPLVSLPEVTPAGTAEVPDILIATAASRSDKLWSTDAWISLIQTALGSGLTIGLLGAPVEIQRRSWFGASAEDQILATSRIADLRGRWRLPEVVGAVRHAKAVVSLDNGILHIAGSVGTPAIGLYRRDIHRLWARPNSSVTALVPEAGCPVESIPADRVTDLLPNLLGAK